MGHSKDHKKSAKDDPIAMIEEAIGGLISRMRVNWKDNATAVHPGLQPVGYSILATLVRHESMPLGDVVEMLALDKSVLSRQVRMLEEWGLVETSPDPSDGRARILHPTPKGITAIADVRSKGQARFHERLLAWSDDDLTAFAKYLRRLTTTDNSAPKAR